MEMKNQFDPPLALGPRGLSHFIMHLSHSIFYICLAGLPIAKLSARAGCALEALVFEMADTSTWYFGANGGSTAQFEMPSTYVRMCFRIWSAMIVAAALVNL